VYLNGIGLNEWWLDLGGPGGSCGIGLKGRDGTRGQDREYVRFNKC